MISIHVFNIFINSKFYLIFYIKHIFIYFYLFKFIIYLHRYKIPYSFCELCYYQHLLNLEITSDH